MSTLVRYRAVVGAMLIGATSFAASAQGPVAVTVVTGAGSTVTRFADNAPITIALGTVTDLVQVFILHDEPVSGLIGAVEIQGSADVFDSDTPAEVRVAITASAFPLQTNLVLLPACATFGGTGANAGLRVVNPSDANDESLRRVTRLALAARNEINGDITVGQIQRIEAGDRITTPGTITGGNVPSHDRWHGSMPTYAPPRGGLVGEISSRLRARRSGVS